MRHRQKKSLPPAKDLALFDSNEGIYQNPAPIPRWLLANIPPCIKEMVAMENARPIRRALISVSDKTGIVEFAQALANRGVDILSTGGTARLLAEQGIKVTEVSDHTGFPEMMDGRVKTLHPKIHGGVLGRRGTDDAVMNEHGIAPIDMVVVNLYPFAATVANPDCTLEDAVENIDIGGPTMVRSAAKNHKDVTIVVNAHDYSRVLAELETNNGSLAHATRFDLAIAAFEHTAAYDGMIANYFGTMVHHTATTRKATNLLLKTKVNSRVLSTSNSRRSRICATVRTATKPLLFTLKRIRRKPLYQQHARSKVKRCLTTTLQIPMPPLSVSKSSTSLPV